MKTFAWVICCQLSERAGVYGQMPRLSVALTTRSMAKM
jgi:hypothetical protein